MREAVFIKQNIDKWREYEYVLTALNSYTPDYLMDVYTELTTDLSFARTHYPNARITQFLNDMTLQLHSELYHVKHERRSRLLTFWTEEIPLAVWHARREILTSLVIFLVAILVGVVSTLGDETFPRLIMGDDYIDMTIANIEQGEPMGVYGTESGTSMFLAISFNNIKVSLLAFALGVFTSIMVGWLMFSNGVMVGAFLTFFLRYGLLGTSALTIMLHGTLELTSIVISGGAGIVMGNGWLFPGTYSRIESFKRSAKRGLKVVLAIVPVLVVAALIESFVTRHTEWPLAVKWTVIIVSALFIVYYFILCPVRAGRRERERENE